MSNRPEIIVVSPHRDDAAFSCGLVTHAALETLSVRIVNIFTCSTYAPFDEAVERNGMAAVTELRRREDEAALDFLRTLSVRPARLEETNLGLLDAPLRLDLVSEDVQGEVLDASGYEREVQLLAGSSLKPLLKDAACVLLPLGLGGHSLDGHVDHRLARDAGRLCAEAERIAFYEDLPYAARMQPVDRESAIKSFISSLVDVQPLVVQRPNAGTLKSKLASFYASQIDAATIEEMANYTGERGGERVYAAHSAGHVLQAIKSGRDIGEGRDARERERNTVNFDPDDGVEW